MTYPPPKALHRLPPSRNKQVRSAIAAIRVLLRKKLLQEAAVQLQQIQQVDPGNVEIALLQAELLTLAGDHDRSCQLLKQILAQHPGLLPALALSARAHSAAQRHLEALDVLKLAHELAPGDQGIARQLVDTLTVLRRPADAAGILESVAGKAKTSFELAQIAALYDKAGDLKKCLSTYDQLKLPGSDLHVLKAGALLAHGQKTEALTSVQEAWSLDPDNASLRLFIAKNFVNEFDPAQQIREIDTILASPDSGRLTAEDRARLGFALGLTRERSGDFAGAYQAIEEANRQAAPESYAGEQQVEKVAQGIADHFTRARLAQLAPAGHSSPQPVFVTGLPRSGTTLVEQIVVSHPDATSLGELELIPALKQSLVSLKSQDINRCAQAWLATVPDNKSGSKKILDKSISSALYTGLAALMFPKARFVFVRRHPMDVFWSAYREMFGSGAVKFTYSPEMLVRRIQFCEHIMAVWQERLPDRILTVKYEDIVTNTEDLTHEIVAHTGLEWSDACLTFHKSKTVVRTASMAQVRQPVYTSSIGKWQAYRTQLEPVASALAELIANYEKTSG